LLVCSFARFAHFAASLFAFAFSVFAIFTVSQEVSLRGSVEND
jgi:hypothetical protein